MVFTDGVERLLDHPIDPAVNLVVSQDVLHMYPNVPRATVYRWLKQLEPSSVWLGHPIYNKSTVIAHFSARLEERNGR